MDRTVDIISVCFCKESLEAINISKYGEPHVHCPCDKCKGKATWRMTAWRHTRANNISKCGGDLTNQSSNDVAKEPAVGDSEEMEVSDLETVSDCHSATEGPSSGSELESSDALSPELESGANAAEMETESVAESASYDNQLGEDHNDNSNISPNVFIRDAVLRLLEMKEKLSCSEKHFEELLEWGKKLHVDGNPDAEQHWPNSWNEVQTLLSKIGFVKPKQYWICLSSVHPCHYGLMESRNELCPHCGERGNIPYYYLSLTEKVKMWCSCPEMCKKMSAHWTEQEHWLPDEMKQGWGWNFKKELWDGTRFAELSYFWDPNAAWILPVRCPYEGCCNVVSAEQITDSPTANNDMNRLHVVTCKECGTSFNHCPSEVRGDPRNIALCGK